MPAYLTIDSATDVRAWSGLNLNIRTAIEKAGIQIDPIAENLRANHTLVPRIASKCWSFFDRNYPLERNRSVARQWSCHADSIISTHRDVRTVISTSTIGIAQLPLRYKTAIWADATFHSLRTTYPEFGNLSASSIASGDWIERTAYDRASLVCFSSDWAANDAAEFYKVSRSKLAVVPFGANCARVFKTESEAATFVASKSYEVCHILFVGVDWIRKGGPLILDAVRHLHKRGIPVVLSIVGCSIPDDQDLEPWVKQYGFLNKQNPLDFAVFDSLFKSAHLLCVPSIAECFGLVYAEASAYAVPSIARDVGGVSNAIKDQKNGFLLRKETSGWDLAELILSIWDDRSFYKNLALNAYKQWADFLNWEKAGDAFVENLRSLIDPDDLK